MGTSTATHVSPSFWNPRLHFQASPERPRYPLGGISSRAHAFPLTRNPRSHNQSVSRIVEIPVFRDRNGCAGLAGSSIPSIALPALARRQKRVLGQIDHRAGLAGSPIASVAIPSASERVQIGIRRHCDRDAGLIDDLVPPIALPSAGAVRVGMARHLLRGFVLRRCHGRPGHQRKRDDQEQAGGDSPQ